MSNLLSRIVGAGATPVGKLHCDSTALACQAIKLALLDAGLSIRDIDAFIATPSLSSPHFMPAHYIATRLDLFKSNPLLLAQTVDVGGASPISAINLARTLIAQKTARSILIVSSDAVLTLPSDEFAQRSNASIPTDELNEPRIPNGYDRYAQFHMKNYGLSREQLAMVPVLMSSMSSRHPGAMCKRQYTLDEVLSSRRIAPVTNLAECARRADGAASLVVCEDHFYRERNCCKNSRAKPFIWSVGESSGPLYPPPAISREINSCAHAAKIAYEEAHVGSKNIDFFGLYDCFPICFIRAVEAVGLAAEGEGGAFVEQAYNGIRDGAALETSLFPINSHGGLMCYGAPWEVPSLYNVVESIEQMSGTAGQRQVIPTPRTALVYGNGGIFSSSAVAILGMEKHP